MENYEELEKMEDAAQQPAAPNAETVAEITEPVEEQPAEPAAEPVAEAAAGQPAAETVYRGAGAGRKESPYANSPYVMQHSAPVEPKQRKTPKTPKAKAKKGGFFRKLLAAVLVLALLGGSCGLTAYLVNDYWEDETERMEKNFSLQVQNLQSQIDAMSPASTGNSVSEGMTPSQVYARNVNSVVLISCEVAGASYGQPAVGYSSGSGFILSENGYILTNAHVVEGATSVTVTTYAGREYAATVCGADSTNDVAVLKVDEEGLPAVTVGSSADLIVGDQVVAIGNPLGELTATMTVGYVSAKDRDVTTDGTTINMIQTDAAINSGNSGGPLFNMKGEVVGITSAKYSGASSSGATIEGIGFAIPMDDVMKLTGDLMEFG